MSVGVKEAPALDHRGLGDAEAIHPSQLKGTASVADSAAVIVRIDRILVQNRYRQSFEAIDELAASIVEIGLLNPITVTEYHGGFRLVAGERRLRAFQSLGLTDIPARIARNIYEARDLLVAERDENTQRKEMLRSEAAALGMAIEALEKPAAQQRQAATQLAGRAPTGDPLFGAGPGTRAENTALRPRDIAAEAIGMGEATYRRVKQAIETAADEEETPEVREVARDAIEQMDAGAPVRAQAERIAEAKKTLGKFASRGTREEQEEKWAEIGRLANTGLTSAQIASRIGLTEQGLKAGAKQRDITFPADRFVSNTRRINSTDVLEKTVSSLEATATILDLVSYESISTEQALEWLARLEEPLRAIRRMQHNLKEANK